jgi:hypothetical protein
MREETVVGLHVKWTLFLFNFTQNVEFVNKSY